MITFQHSSYTTSPTKLSATTMSTRGPCVRQIALIALQWEIKVFITHMYVPEQRGVTVIREFLH